MSSNKPTDPRMTKAEAPKNIYYQYSSLKKLLSEEDIAIKTAGSAEAAIWKVLLL